MRLGLLAVPWWWALAGWLTAAGAELSSRGHWIGPAEEGPAPSVVAGGLAVADDGTCWVSPGPSARAPRVTWYRDGQVIGRAAVGDPGAGDRLSGPVAVSAEHLWVAAVLGPGLTAGGAGSGVDDGSRPPSGEVWPGVWRLARNGEPAPWSEGRLAGRAFLRVGEASPAGAALPQGVTGLWVHEGRVFASDAGAGRIRVYDAATGEPVGSGFPADQPSGLCVLAGRLQVIERGAVVSAFTLDGRRTGQVLDEGDDLVPVAVAPTREGRLMVADRGVSQQVHFFNMSGVPTRVRTLGDEGGLYGPPAPGEAGPRRLAGIAGVGADAAGRYYVADSPPPGGLALRGFDADRKGLRWQFTALALRHGADADPRSDGLVLHSSEGRQALDLTRPPGQSVRWVAQSVNPFRYPRDPRLSMAGAPTPGAADAATGIGPAAFGGTTTFREIDGHPLLAVRSPDGRRLVLFRFEGQTAVPAVVMNAAEEPGTADSDLPGHPAAGPWIWRDANGDGETEAAEFAPAPAIRRARFQATPIDARGAIWFTSADDSPRLCQWVGRGMGEARVPVYDAPLVSASAAGGPDGVDGSAGAGGPVALDSWYDAVRDTLYRVESAGAGAGARRAAVRAYDGWSKRPSDDASPGMPRWECVLPESVVAAGRLGLAAAGEVVLVFDPETREILVIGAAGGRWLGRLRLPASARPGSGGTGAPGIRAHHRRDGSYLVLTQDPDAPRVWVHHLDNPLPPSPAK